MWRDSKKRLFQFGMAAGVMAIAAAVSAPVAAQDRTSRHNLGSGPDVYRVEVRNLYRLQVLEAGDSDGTGELHEMVIELSAPDRGAGTQFDRRTYSGTWLYSVNEGGIIQGDRYFPIRAGQHVFTQTDRTQNNETQFWVHSNADPESSYMGGGTVRLTVHAQELDCAGQRVCRRRSNGSVYVEFRIPEFTRRPSNRCGPDNTFRLEPLDGRIQISGLSHSTVFSATDSESWYLGVNHNAGGPRLIPFNAEICVASTIRP